ncbi:MAG TPA: anti-sigma factor [Candidatus Binatia bacterium]|nr:anti-sigma factor [Candidatus Binatia bacterium]
MNHEAARNLLDAYLDGELDPAGRLEVERHLQECQLCSQGYEEQSALKRAVGGSGLRYKAPAELQQRIRFALRREANAEKSERTVPRRWFAAAASLAVAALALLVVLPFVRDRRADDLVARDVLGAHVRSLMANHLADVSSSDKHTVKPWFDGKLDFSPPVEDLAAQGFPLIGGRLDYVDNRPVAALVYQRKKHFINVFVWPAESRAADAKKIAERQGYDLFHWTKGGMNYWAVSDLEESDLRSFVDMLQKGAAGGKS